MPFNLNRNNLWTIAYFKPKSKRFSQLSFEGFRPKGRNKLEQFLHTFGEFISFSQKYIYRKLRSSFLIGQQLGKLSIRYTQLLKAYLIRKLIWSRGRLGRPIAISIVMSFAFFVFMFGKVFNSSKFVNRQEIDPDYLASVTDIIPQKNIALTTIPEDRKRSEPFAYVVQSGDTLSSIGNDFKISTAALQYVNNLSDSSVLKPGQEVIIPPIAGLIHKVQSGDSLTSIAKKYDVPPQAIADFNYILDTSKLAVGTELVVPDAKIPQPVYIPPVSAVLPPLANVDTSASKGWCVWPTSVRIITQYFAWYHDGLDIATPTGFAMPPLYSCAEGTVTRAGWDPWGLGLHVRVDHGNGYETVYGHMSRVDVGYGERVSKGQTIGLMGSTGRSTGAHVHFIVKYKGVAQNPLNYIQ